MDDDLIEQWAAPPSPTKPSGWGDWDTAEEEAASWDFSTFEPPLPVVSEDAVFGYIEKFRPLINLELEEEKQQVMDRLGRWSLSRLQSEGLVVIGLKGRQVGSFFGKPLVAFELENRGMLPYHRFGSGDLVMISRNNPVVEKPTKDGQVIEATPYEIRVACTVVPGNGVWRLDRGSNVTAYQRMKAALKGVTSDLDSGSQFPLIDFSIRSGGPRKAKKKSKARKFDDDDYSPFEDAEDEKWLLPTRGTKLRSLLIDPEQHKEWAAQPSGLLSKEAILWAEELAVSLAPRRPTDQDSDLGLNMSQVKAVTLAIRSRLSLLQGPPGTGKTSTIVKFIRVLRKQFKAKFPILACAQSNVAVDNLLEGLHDQGVSAVRVGQPVKVRESLRGRTLDALLENHPTKAEIESVKRELSHVQYKLRTANGKDIGLVKRSLATGKRDLKLLTKKISKLREKMMSSILKKADVICSTCVGAGGPQLEDLDFPMVVLDEGSQCRLRFHFSRKSSPIGLPLKSFAANLRR
ncbi:Tripartite DNA replication factor [Borealophlyctis nickersoniae]|nr:Tripartite DNA replication factor [Borealophlyctis nickersoniae]